MSSTRVFHLPLLWLSLCLMEMVSLGYGEKRCCPRQFMRDGSTTNCTNERYTELNCTNGAYKIDPRENPEDAFLVVNGELVIDHGNVAVPEDRFCLANSAKTRNLIAIVCFDVYDDPHQQDWRYNLFGIMNIISTIFLMVTLVVYVLLPELRDLQGKVMMSMMATLAVAYSILAIEQMEPIVWHDNNNETLCVTVAFMMYYAFLSAFFWLNLVAFNIWRSVWIKNCAIKDNSLFTIYCVIGWSGPAIFVIAALIGHHATKSPYVKPGFGETSCWFNGYYQTWVYFYIPVACLLSLNVIYFGMTGWRLWHECQDYNGNKLRALRVKCILYLKLILVMGISWIFEVLSFVTGKRNAKFWLPMDILNSLQGPLIFFLMVFFRKRVWKLAAKRKPCGINFPKSWVAGQDEECESILPEEVELSRPA